MANQPQQLSLPPPRTYSRTEFAALRARVQGVPVGKIAQLYFDSDTSPYPDEPEQLERFLRTMRDDLVQLAILHGSPVLADHLRASIAKHGSARLARASLQMVEQASRLAVAAPQAGHAVGLWFRPLIARHLAGEGIQTLAELVAFANRRGGSWWRAVPRIGFGRARVIVAWLRRHADTLGVTVSADVDAAEPLVAPGDPVVIGPASGQLAPLERMALPHALSGERGTNRAPVFPYVRARHDLDAVRAYLAGYAGQTATQRAYVRELERLVLWATMQRGVALSSLTVEDCEAYKAFLAAPAAAFTGPPMSRKSGRWRPFAPGGLSTDSQRYAVRAIRAAFDWLVDVRYLAGNPWRAVKDPRTVRRAQKMKIDRALPIDLWTRVRVFLAERSDNPGPQAERWRAARALLLLMGDSGLRIAEAAAARRPALEWLPADRDVPPTWLLQVIGKGDRERFVPVSDECIAALQAHWRDRGLDFAAPDAGAPLVAPIFIPGTKKARKKFGLDTGKEDVTGVPLQEGYSVRGARGLNSWAIRQMLEHLTHLNESERWQLAHTSPHALRHTFGTQSVAADVPLDVVQRIMGHASLQTTTTYVTAERRRMRAEVAKYHARLTGSGQK
ncbi:Tyrosine recombinase XerC [Paraburkholderia aspalathi]|uniref:Tyrosine recombinase XerC n=1 Tax=Paraburkholderia aspalathi TaxID=1324617 RepID=A0ABM8SMN8_9BURK|nr:site-specific integrase [Paraburkholderia aspalathi]MBK3822157.1 tyrosine-type recombinase/integrase [Paraburkholderia aspalathi]MBK3833991.1 tyrosine-type recombinase/integrase [Paraburkholderia aspalathi]MBK3863714.1 tyrosine-type recombinase/integrase [Paraburkholderia aspalathi]CAE6820893.1 Tyrosine recombinase XerC [Paraburkholderia aspalathi]